MLQNSVQIGQNDPPNETNRSSFPLEPEPNQTSLSGKKIENFCPPETSTSSTIISSSNNHQHTVPPPSDPKSFSPSKDTNEDANSSNISPPYTTSSQPFLTSSFSSSTTFNTSSQKNKNSEKKNLTLAAQLRNGEQNHARSDCMKILNDIDDNVDPSQEYDMSFLIKLSDPQLLSSTIFKTIIDDIISSSKTNTSNPSSESALFNNLSNHITFFLISIKTNSTSNDTQSTTYALKITMSADLLSLSSSKERLSIIISNAFNKQNIKVRDQTQHNTDIFSVLKLLIPPTINSSFATSIANKIFSPYGEIIHQQSDFDQSCDTPALRFSDSPIPHYIILKLNDRVLPPRTIKSSVPGFKNAKIFDFITTISHGPNHCIFCRCLDHSIENCPIKPQCRTCHGSRHRKVFCSQTSPEDQQNLFDKLPIIIQKMFFDRLHPKTLLPLWALRKRASFNPTVDQSYFQINTTIQPPSQINSNKRTRMSDSTPNRSVLPSSILEPTSPIPTPLATTTPLTPTTTPLNTRAPLTFTTTTSPSVPCSHTNEAFTPAKSNHHPPPTLIFLNTTQETYNPFTPLAQKDSTEAITDNNPVFNISDEDMLEDDPEDDPPPHIPENSHQTSDSRI